MRQSLESWGLTVWLGVILGIANFMRLDTQQAKPMAKHRNGSAGMDL